MTETAMTDAPDNAGESPPDADVTVAEIEDLTVRLRAVLARHRGRADRAEAALTELRERIAGYESAVAFETTCTGCAARLQALEAAEAERDEARADLRSMIELCDVMRPVVDKALAWHRAAWNTAAGEEAKALSAAVDTYLARVPGGWGGLSRLDSAPVPVCEPGCPARPLMWPHTPLPAPKPSPNTNPSKTRVEVQP